MNTFDAIFSRRSIRHFIDEKLDWEVISDILDFANKLPALTEGIAVEFKLVSNIEAKQGFRGPFSIKAPYYLCISSEEKGDYLLNAGYLMQLLNLYIVSKGLGTCFMVGTPGIILKSNMKYKYIVALAFGKSATELYRDSSQAKRLPEKEIVVYKEEVSEDIKQVLTAARLAPSSYNNQPWRFVVFKNRIHIFAKKNPLIAKAFDFMKMVDMGIMLANLLLASEELWIDITLNASDSLKTKQLKSNEYIRTVIIG